MYQSIINLSRPSKLILLLLFDTITVILSLFAAFSMRLGYLFFPSNDTDLQIIIFAAPFLAVPIFYKFELYFEIIRFVSFRSIWRIFQAVSLHAILWGLITFMADVDGIPRSVILINWLLLIASIAGSRLFIRWILSSKFNKALEKKTNVIIYGAGTAGRQLSTALSESIEYNPVAFIDDDKKIFNHSINGLKVYSKSDLKNLISNLDIKEVLLAIPSLSRQRRREIIEFLEPFPLIVRSLPSVSELAQGKIKVNDLLEIDLKDLLGRDSVMPNKKLLKVNIQKKVILITGAGGSIGSELCRQALLLGPKKIILYEHSESALYEIEQELNQSNLQKIEVIPVIGSVIDKQRMKKIFNHYGVQTVYHAAAYKHVPLVEFNQSQGVLNNIVGTRMLAEASISCNIEIVVLISTDKAVKPTNIMGVSKRVAELILQALDKQSSNTCFTMVRFGNVLDSSGSVIPLFKKQIKKGGPVTVTHRDIVRYFMTIPEAVELVIQAGAMAKGGEVFVLDMGEAVKIYDLAVKMIQLSGLEVLNEKNPEGDIEIKYTGLRPGEKLFEELLLSKSYTFTENKLIMRAQETMINWNELEPILTNIHELTKKGEKEGVLKLLKTLVPEYTSTSSKSSKERI